MHRRAELTSIDAVPGFVGAAQNQFTFDKFHYWLLALSADKFNVLPRPTKWARKHPAITSLVSAASMAIAVLWGYGLAYFYIFLKAAKCLLRKSIEVNTHVVVPGVDLVLAICDRSCQVISHLKSDASPRIWLKPPGVRLGVNVNAQYGIEVIDALSLLSAREILRSAVNACAAHRYIVSEIDARLGMQSYTVLDWMLTLSAVHKIAPKKIITAEHHDRWAVLADHYCSISRQDGVIAALEVVQHGNEYESTYAAIDQVNDGKGLPYKLKNLSVLQVYDNDQLEIFKKNIVSKSLDFTSDVSVKIVDRVIDLVDTGISGTKVLFVGNPVCEQFQLRIFNSLANAKEIACFYKPHPTAGASHAAKTAGWTVINEKSTFPKVDFLISYPSTLIDEYKSAGIPSITHSLNARDEEFDAVMTQINLHLGTPHS